VDGTSGNSSSVTYEVSSIDLSASARAITDNGDRHSTYTMNISNVFEEPISIA